MKASLEIHSGMLRVHDQDDGKYGDEYIWACGVTFDGDTAKLHGAMLKPSPSIWRAVREVLRDNGVKCVEWDRREHGEHKRNVSIPI